MWLLVVVKDLGQIFARHIHDVRQVVISGRKDDLASAKFVAALVRIFGADDESAITPRNLHHALVLANVELVMLGNVAVVLESFLPVWLLVRAGKRDVADLE